MLNTIPNFPGLHKNSVNVLSTQGPPTHGPNHGGDSHCLELGEARLQRLDDCVVPKHELNII